ncbi:MAG: HAMP domain-containing histidine kinase [Gemmatimonadetes bacterium]|uniref:histidine kinase n=1 Tax=Candidatus Kutchimonas denitrificans TaxID=3056748 RepID=A0AAE5C8U8_9BACT|nr:HAMP domain-containing histidine kinase [Gemmatimonadota bacterium]NIR74806.1 HAMP domain-containing histidine kinase [Candidatus Kutchimonas denitrificans]NIR99917.1 HAMP domain-containing histidine kinase [Gemmatimonadota bacterium]NIT65501.1 HAMP domain-containing histidine kinase [Gemmatimonadota bacterium]NIU52471.1 GHKL domain-containing protein [Gemmatimonadota bacterium]
MRRRRTSFTTRLFVVLFLLSAVPSVALLGLATWGLRDYVELARAAGPWSRIGDTGRELLTAIDSVGADSAVVAVAEEHESELSRSLGLARRWDLIAQRLAAALPWVALVLGLSLAIVAAWSARQLARGLSRPLDEMVDWAERLAAERPLPAPNSDEESEPPEFSTLRAAFRQAAERLAEGRRQALEAERLRAASEMSRRVAHEIKNPLTPLTLAVRQARHFISRGKHEALEEPLQVIAEEAERLDEMARTFAQLGRLPEGPTSEIDLEEMLRSLMASDLPDTIRGTVDARDGVPRVRGHLEALNRAFRNLLGNAVEALGDRPDGRIEVTIASRNDTVEIAIADNGPGIPEEAADRIWDPDFTTRRRGTGLGLALVRQTVRAHGGDIELGHSEEGACFVIRLPKSAETDE